MTDSITCPVRGSAKSPAKIAAARANGAKGGRKSYAVAWIYGRGMTDADGKAIVSVVRGSKAAISAWLVSGPTEYVNAAGYREAITVAELRAMGHDPAQVEHWIKGEADGVDEAAY